MNKTILSLIVGVLSLHIVQAQDCCGCFAGGVISCYEYGAGTNCGGDNCSFTQCQTLTGNPAAIAIACLASSCASNPNCASITILPVELVDFQAKVESKTTILLQWTTLTEIDNEGFEIERSTNAKEWETIGFVQGLGTTNLRQNYQFADKPTVPTRYYYRLKQMDFDGMHAYSNLISVELSDGNATTSVFPNPVKDILYIRNTTGTASLYNLNGQLIANTVLDKELSYNGTGLFRMQNITPGQYILLIVKENGERISQKIIKE